MPKLNITEIYHTVFWYRGSLTNAIFDRIPSLLRFMAKSRQKIAVVGISQILQNPNTSGLFWKIAVVVWVTKTRLSTMLYTSTIANRMSCEYGEK